MRVRVGSTPAAHLEFFKRQLSENLEFWRHTPQMATQRHIVPGFIAENSCKLLIPLGKGGGPGWTRTSDQWIHIIHRFRDGADYIITRVGCRTLVAFYMTSSCQTA